MAERTSPQKVQPAVARLETQMKSIKLASALENRHRGLSQDCIQVSQGPNLGNIRLQASDDLHPPRLRVVEQRDAPILCLGQDQRLHRNRDEDLHRAPHLQARKTPAGYTDDRHRKAIQ